MLSNAKVTATLPAVNIQRARKFYEEKLGLKVVNEDPSPGITLQAGKNTRLYVYQRGATKADHTVAEFTADDVEELMPRRHEDWIYTANSGPDWEGFATATRAAAAGGVHGSGFMARQKRAIMPASTVSFLVRTSSLWAKPLMRAGFTMLTVWPASWR